MTPEEGELLLVAAWIEATHQAVHDSENNLGETTTVALGHRDLIMIGLGLALVGAEYPCLRDENADLQERLTELFCFQQPGWVANPREVPGLPSFDDRDPGDEQPDGPE